MKKFLAILISVILLIGLVPMAVFAAEGDDLSYSELLAAYQQTISSVNTGDAKIDISYELPDAAYITAGKTNELTICIKNNGKALINTNLSLVTPSGITIESGSVKRDTGIILPGKTARVTFPIVCSDNITEGSYAFSVSFAGDVSQYPNTLNVLALIADLIGVDINALTPENISSSLKSISSFLSTFGTADVSSTDTFYVPVKLTEGKGAYTTPRLMLTNYNCGGSVLAGSTFGLGLTLRNTSQEDLYNIKATIVTNNFVPVGSSNSFFIDSIKAGESISKTVSLSCTRDLAQQQYAVVIKTEYEDASGKTQGGEDQISIPVIQEMRLVVDDILDPGWLTMSDTGYANVNYRNMGNNTISNLTIKIDGDFDIEGSNVYYVGNLASGKSDNYSFSFYPHAEGNCKGTVTFTYEDAEGNEHHIDKVFNFNIGPAYSWDDDGGWDDYPVEEPGLPTWAKIAIPAAAIVVAIVIITLLKKRKARKQEALDLDE